MQWMDAQQGRFDAPGIGGFFPTLAGYRLHLRDPGVPAKAPAWGSELFPETGAVLRHGFPGDRETQVHLIAGRNHAHYDDDSGSFTLWGLGRPMADDFGYSGVPAADDHSMLLSKAAGPGEMRVKAFATTERLDVVEGVRGGWTRQIALVKKPGGAAYAAVSDTLPAEEKATWRLWLATDRVDVNGRGACAPACGDAALDVWFARPEGVALGTEKRSRTGPGLRADGSVDARMAVERTGLSATATAAAFTVLLRPRLRDEKAPVLESLAGGRAIRITTAAGTDVVFLAAEPFEFAEGGLTFRGTCGAASIEGDRVSLSLGAAGSIGAGGRSLASEAAASRDW
jgi:hypothetical protein